jgi:hypothetical protein
LDDPPLPAIASNRLADNWRPVFTIARVIGGHWPERLTEAFHALTSSRSSSSSFSSSSSSSLPLPAPPIQQSTNPQIQPPPSHHSTTPSLQLPPAPIHQSTNPVIQPLLTDIRHLFTQAGTDRLLSSFIVNSLRSLPDRPWSIIQNGDKPIDQVWLARQLRPFGISPKYIRIGQARARGYDLPSFTPAFNQFLDGNSAV